VIPFHSGKVLHPKIVKQILQTIDISEDKTTSEEVLPETDE
jgi:hypothetical protein